MSLELRSVEKSFPGFSMRMSVSVGQGELLTLLGPSGCGKTTALHLIAGFLEPDRGVILIGGADVTGLPVNEREVSIVFQDYALFPHLNVRGNVAFGPRMRRWPAPRVEERVDTLLDLVRLPGYRDRRVARLSGGEQQRVALARALAPNPRVLLLDEPLSALDAKLRSDLRREIRRIQRELRVTTVYVTHDQEEALAISDRIALVNQGRIEQTGTPQEVYARPMTLFAAGFMGMENRIHGTVDEAGRGRVRVRTPEGPFTGLCAHSFARGEAAVVLFRAGSCAVGKQRGSRNDIRHPGPENTVRGMVTGSEYLGERTIFSVQGRQGQYSARCNPSLPGWGHGEQVALRAVPEEVWVIPEDDRGGPAPPPISAGETA